MPLPSTTGLYYDRGPGGKIKVKKARNPFHPIHQDSDPTWRFPSYPKLNSPTVPIPVAHIPFARPLVPALAPYAYLDPLLRYLPPSRRRPASRSHSIKSSSSSDTDNASNVGRPAQSSKAAAMDDWPLDSTAPFIYRSNSVNSLLSVPAISPGPRVPFVAAAQQLDSTVRRAIIFFDRFYQDFRIHSDGHRQHADKRLMDSLWQSKIKGSSSHPKRKYEKKKQTTNHETQNENRDQNDNHNSNHTALPPEELFSFHEHQHQVLHRVRQLLRSKPPILPFLAPSPTQELDFSPSSPSYFDPDLALQQKKRYAASNLKEDISHDYRGLQRAMEGMSTTHQQAKTAIRKLKVVKEYLLTYRVAWDDDWDESEDGVGDSDDDGGEGRD